jgi:UrcA family protein
MKPLVLAAAVVCLSAPLPVSAGTRVVSVADLVLTSAAGHAAAVLRIRRAAFDLCREVPVEGVGQLWDWLKFMDCARDATQTAAARLPPIAAGR